MTYVVDEKCIKCKTTDCVAVCPVDCFYEGENMLVIHPEECIDCGVCEPECPVDAIKADSAPGMEKWLELNREYSLKWPQITLVSCVGGILLNAVAYSRVSWHEAVQERKVADEADSDLGP